MNNHDVFRRVEPPVSPSPPSPPSPSPPPPSPPPVPPSPPPLLATPTVLVGSFTVAGDVETLCDAAFKEAVTELIRTELGTTIDAEVKVSCAGGSFVVSYTVSIPTGTLVTDAAAAQQLFEATFSNATATETALQARLSATGSNTLLDIEAIVAPYAAASPSPPPTSPPPPSTPPPTPTQPATSALVASGAISPGAVAGIVVAMLCCCAAVGVGVALVVRRRRAGAVKLLGRPGVPDSRKSDAAGSQKLALAHQGSSGGIIATKI